MSVSAGAKVQRRTSGLSDKVRKRIEITILSLPALIMFLGFVILPVFMAGYYGFFKWKGYGKPTVNGQFIGFENYKVILTDPNFQQALGHTLFVVVASLVIQGPLAILLRPAAQPEIQGPRTDSYPDFRAVRRFRSHRWHRAGVSSSRPQAH